MLDKVTQSVESKLLTRLTTQRVDEVMKNSRCSYQDEGIPTNKVHHPSFREKG
jgi:hypothetical protein